MYGYSNCIAKRAMNNYTVGEYEVEDNLALPNNA
jgi:hypothetical protein